MPSDIVVEFEDGSTHTYKDAPDNVTRDQVASRAMKQFGKKVKPISEPQSQLVKEVSRVGSDIVKGLGSMGALAIDANAPQGQAAVDMAQAMIPREGSIFPDFFSSGKKIEDKPLEFGASKALQSIGPKAVTEREKFQSAITQGAAGAFMGPGGLAATTLQAPVRAAVTGAGAGLGAELGGRMSGDSFLGRLIGGIVGGFGANKGVNFAAAARPQSSTLAKEAMEGVTPEAMARATELQAAAKAQGVDMDIAQALGAVGAPNSNLKTLRDVIANTSSGDKVKATLREQPLQLEQLAGKVEASLPGPTVGRNEAANQVTKAATSALDEVRADYARAGTVTSKQIGDLVRAIDGQTNAPGASSALKTTADGLKQRLQALQKTGTNNSTYGIGSRDVPALDVNVALGDAMGAYKGSPTYLADPLGTGQVKRLGATLNEQFKTFSPGIRTAEAKYAYLSKTKVDPLKQGPVGQIAGRAGYLDDKQSPAGTLENLFKRGSDPKVADSAREIPILMNTLRKSDPEAVPGAVKEFIRGRLNSAFSSEPGATVAAPIGARDSASKLYDSLFKTKSQMQGMQDMTAGTARSMGLSPEDVAKTVKGMENFAQITRALSNTTADGMDWKEVARLGGRSKLASAARTFGMIPFNQAANRFEEAVLAKTFRQFDDILTNPDGLRMLQELSQVSPKSGKALAIMSTFGGTLPNATNDNPGE